MGCISVRDWFERGGGEAVVLRGEISNCGIESYKEEHSIASCSCIDRIVPRHNLMKARISSVKKPKERSTTNPTQPCHVYTYPEARKPKSSQLFLFLLQQELINKTLLRRPMYHSGRIIIVFLLLLDLNLMLYNRPVLRRRRAARTSVEPN